MSIEYVFIVNNKKNTYTIITKLYIKKCLLYANLSTSTPFEEILTLNGFFFCCVPRLFLLIMLKHKILLQNYGNKMWWS